MSSQVLHVRWTENELGRMLVGTTERGLAFLGFVPERAEADAFEHAQGMGLVVQGGAHDLGARTAQQLAEHARGERREFDLPLDLHGTDFQRAVWAELCRIPYGETRTYGELARALGRPGASRAVGGANGRNPVPIVVPCHRVVATGGIGGFSGGLDRKRRLLALEGRPTAHQITFAP